MDSEVQFSFTVGTIHEASTMCNVCSDITVDLLNKAFILDIDLDAFSTTDPFRSAYTAGQVMSMLLFALCLLLYYNEDFLLLLLLLVGHQFSDLQKCYSK